MKKILSKYSAIILLVLPVICLASEGATPGETIIHHLVDTQEWKPLPYLPGIPLPTFHIGGFELKVTTHVIMMWLSSLLLAATFIPAFRKRALVPQGIAGFLEPVVLFVKNDIVMPTMGEDMGKKWTPFFFTVFFFILGCNLLGLVHSPLHRR